MSDVHENAGHEPNAPLEPGIPQIGHPAELLGTAFAHFQVEEAIGPGAAGLVFRAVDKNDGQTVALKVMHPEFSQNEPGLQRFVLAMKAAMQLQHPNLIQIYGAGRVGPFIWISMELVNGQNMAEVLERKGVARMLDWKNAFRVAMHIGRALEYAHGQKIIHRNITPTNILMDEATKAAKLGDLMLARALEGELAQKNTSDEHLVGEVNYLSPELTHGAGSTLDVRSDLFSLGGAVYALLTGTPPFAAKSMIDTIFKIRNDSPAPPSTLQIGIPGQLEGVVMKLLKKNPDERFQSATEMLKELKRVGTFAGVSV